MKNVLLACVLLFAFSCNSQKDHIVQDVEEPRMLYVLNSASGTYEDDQLKLEGVLSVIYFSDRPSRLAGHISLKKFTKGVKSQDTTKGVLSLLDKNQDIDLALSSPKRDGDTITFKVEEGKLPKTFERSSLFIDLDPQEETAFNEGFHSVDCSCADTALNTSE
ncbi:MAG: hypothetical protein P0S96_07760 [Simkaniaceae bacterium]|nr:hypothetical protein [Candidatus Sacchlamyda saccharinae]